MGLEKQTHATMDLVPYYRWLQEYYVRWAKAGVVCLCCELFTVDNAPHAYWQSVWAVITEDHAKYAQWHLCWIGHPFDAVEQVRLKEFMARKEEHDARSKRRT